jgi:hypothetical protein
MRQSYTNIQQQQQALGQWLSPIEWNYWATPTTGYTLTQPSARRAMHRLHDALDRFSPCEMFWASEPFDTKEGFHTHALIKSALPFKIIVDTWQQVSGNTKFERGKKWNRIQLDDYNPELGAGYYCGKYITKKLSDYDYLTPGASNGYMSTKKRK